MHITDCENHSTRRAAIAEGDNDPEEDYLEAEIESTDSVRVAVNELFGVRLLEMKFRLWNGDDKSATARCEASNIGRDEITAPPGTVPRRAPQLRKPTTVTVRRSLASVSRIASLSAESVCVPDRPTSISSQQTFILENDRRKPLVARNAFQSAAVNPPPQLQSAPKQNAKESGNRTAIKVPSRGMSEPRALKQSHVSIAELNKPGLNGSSSKSQSLLGTEEEPKADDFLPDVPVTSSFPRRIPENANTYEYVAAFGSRPKILRTPDKQRSKSTYARKGAKRDQRKNGGGHSLVRFRPSQIQTDDLKWPTNHERRQHFRRCRSRADQQMSYKREHRLEENGDRLLAEEDDT
ncbi:hypothetical protein Tcan_17889 [Toxocara canis]|uniref:Uncharacterized protein n=1 Tax=Toxocara canis TaxID=6265 RepID=A0A0B2VTK1_TOXCA|nr:hypothetical protein Tcan_17889 [Toxocara canis]